MRTVMTVVDVGDVRIGEGQPLCLIAGPCVIESEAVVLQTAERLARIGVPPDADDNHGTQVVNLCPAGTDLFYHVITDFRPDDGTSFHHNPSSTDPLGWLNPSKGRGEFCMGHKSMDATPCSPKLYPGEIIIVRLVVTRPIDH